MLKYNLYVLNESTAILLNKKSIDCLHLNSVYIIKSKDKWKHLNVFKYLLHRYMICYLC